MKGLPVETGTFPRKIGEYPDMTPLQNLSCINEGRKFLRENQGILKSLSLESWFLQSEGTPIIPFLTFCSTEEDSKFILGAEFGLLDRITSEIWATPVILEKYFGMNLFASVLGHPHSKKLLLSYPRPLKISREIWLRRGNKGTHFQDANALVILIGSEKGSYEGIDWLENNPGLLEEIPLEAWNSKAFFLLCATPKGRDFLIKHPKIFNNMPEAAWLMYPALYLFCHHSETRKRFLESPEILCRIPMKAWKTINMEENFKGTNPLFFLFLERFEHHPEVSNQHYLFFSKLPKEVWLAASRGSEMTGCNPLFLFLLNFPQFLLHEPRILEHIPGEAWSAEIDGGISALWMLCAKNELMPILIKNPEMLERVPKEVWKRVPQYSNIFKIDGYYKISPLVFLAGSEDASSFLVNHDFLLDMLEEPEVTLPEDVTEEFRASFFRMKSLAKTLPTFKKMMRLFVAIDSTEINFNTMAIIFRFRKTNTFEKNFKILELLFNYFKIEFAYEEGGLILGLTLDKFLELSLERLNFISELCSQLQNKGELVEKNEALIKKIGNELEEKSKAKREGTPAAEKKPSIIRVASPPQVAAPAQAPPAVKKKSAPSKNKNPKGKGNSLQTLYFFT